MKTYKRLLSSLPKKTIVTAFCKFDPVTAKHNLLIQFLKKIAVVHNADILVFVSQDGIIPIKRRLHYIELLYPDIKVKQTVALNFSQAIKELSPKYRQVVAISDTLENEEIENYFDSVKIINVKPYIDFDEYSEKALSLAELGDWEKFKKQMSHNLRMLDARRMFNDIRQSYGKEEILESVKIENNDLRENYIAGNLYNIGDKIITSGELMTVVRRGTNYVSLINEVGQTKTKFITEL